MGVSIRGGSTGRFCSSPELPEEEKEYYRKYQFQALTQEDAADLMNLQGIEGVRGFTSHF